MKVPTLLQTPNGPVESRMRWGYRLWTGSNSQPELFNDWFRFQNVMLKGAPDIIENFRVRRCLIPFDSFQGNRYTTSPNTAYEFKPRFKEPLAFGGIQSDVGGLAIILQYDKKGWHHHFGPGMPTFVRASDAGRYLNNSTTAEEADSLLQQFHPDMFLVEKLSRDFKPFAMSSSGEHS